MREITTDIAVIGAGAAQTMVNVNRVLPGKRVVMLGSGNVGLIVSYQLMQAGADVVALVEAALKSAATPYTRVSCAAQAYPFWSVTPSRA